MLVVVPPSHRGSPAVGVQDQSKQPGASSTGVGLMAQPSLYTTTPENTHKAVLTPTDTASGSSEAPECSVVIPSMGNYCYFWGDQGCPEGMAGAGCRVPGASGSQPGAIAAAQPPPASFATQADQNSWALVIPALGCGINDSNAGTEIQERIGFTTLLGYFVLFYWGKPFFSCLQGSLQ